MDKTIYVTLKTHLPQQQGCSAELKLVNLICHQNFQWKCLSKSFHFFLLHLG